MKITIEDWDGAHRTIIKRTLINGNKVKYGGREWYVVREGGKWVLDRPVQGNPSRSRRLTKTQKKANASKRAKQRRVALALKKFLHAQNPAVKYSGAAVVKLKGGAVRITPIKAKRGTR